MGKRDENWRQPPIGHVPLSVGPEDETPPAGMISVMGARLPAPLPRMPVSPPFPSIPPPASNTLARLGKRTLPGMPPPPHAIAHVPVPEFSDEDEITEPASPGYRERRLMADWRALSDFDKRRVERHIQALHATAARKR